MEKNTNILDIVREDLGTHLETMTLLYEDLWSSLDYTSIQQLLIDISPAVSTRGEGSITWLHLSGKEVHLYLRVRRDYGYDVCLLLGKHGLIAEPLDSSIAASSKDLFMIWNPSESWGYLPNRFKLVVFFEEPRE